MAPGGHCARRATNGLTRDEAETMTCRNGAATPSCASLIAQVPTSPAMAPTTTLLFTSRPMQPGGPSLRLRSCGQVELGVRVSSRVRRARKWVQQSQACNSLRSSIEHVNRGRSGSLMSI